MSLRSIELLIAVHEGLIQNNLDHLFFINSKAVGELEA